MILERNIPMRIELASEAAAQECLPQLNELLMNAVNSGASIGWLPPLNEAAAESYWNSRMPEISAGNRVLLLGWEGDTLVGSAQLGLEQRENGNHRAEVQKVMVHTDYRRRGIAQQLMRVLEECAVQNQRSLLFLDTREGDAAEELYQKLGYVKVGAIPNYVRKTGGGFEGTVVYYKILF
jgi:ribosomal protein S18 acetylase RimI-like enzyme